jgi:hypothetical protein
MYFLVDGEGRAYSRRPASHGQARIHAIKLHSILNASIDHCLIGAPTDTEGLAWPDHWITASR